WTAVADSKFGNSGIDAIAYGNGRFVAVGTDGKMAYSTDGVSWTAVLQVNNGGFSSRIWGIAFGAAGNAGGRFVAGGDNGSMAYSADGASWAAVGEGILGTYTTLMGSRATADISAVAYGNGRFVAVGQGGNIAYADW
ncbi:MAG: hypothetical protein LBQ89_06085, partial [Treponema sp.]|nr:hypothetical protein [Treponema sp.]